MAIVSSGPISLGTTAGTDRSISAEFGGDAAHSLSEYYDKGNAPSSGEIQMGADFYGTSDGVWFSAPTLGSEHTFNPGTPLYRTTEPSVAWDPHTAGRFAIAYADWESWNHGTHPVKGKVQIGTVSGTTISWGSEYEFYSPLNAYNAYCSIVWDPHTANKFMVIYRSATNYSSGGGKIGTVASTNVITFGSEYQWTTNALDSAVKHCRLVFDPNTSGSFVIVWETGRGYPRAYGRVIAGTISGTTITYGTGVTYTDRFRAHSLAFDPNTAGKFGIAYTGDNTSFPDYNYHGRVVIGTVSGTTVTLGTPVTFAIGAGLDGRAIDSIDIAFDPNDSGKFVVAYKDTDYNYEHGSMHGGLNSAKAIVGTRSGTSCTFGTAVNFGTDGVLYDLNIDFGATGKCLIFYKIPRMEWTGSLPWEGWQVTDGDTRLIIGTVSGTSTTWGTEVTVQSPGDDVVNQDRSARAIMRFDPTTVGRFIVLILGDGDGSFKHHCKIGNCYGAE